MSCLAGLVFFQSAQVLTTCPYTLMLALKCSSLSEYLFMTSVNSKLHCHMRLWYTAICVCAISVIYVCSTLPYVAVLHCHLCLYYTAMCSCATLPYMSVSVLHWHMCRCYTAMFGCATLSYVSVLHCHMCLCYTAICAYTTLPYVSVPELLPAIFVVNSEI